MSDVLIDLASERLVRSCEGDGMCDKISSSDRALWLYQWMQKLVGFFLLHRILPPILRSHVNLSPLSDKSWLIPEPHLIAFYERGLYSVHLLFQMSMCLEDLMLTQVAPSRPKSSRTKSKDEVVGGHCR